jgi:predicted peptidase
MKTRLFVFGLSLALILAGCGVKPTKSVHSGLAQPGQHAMSFEKQVSLDCHYLLFLPEEYGRNEKKWPLILFLHGAGERGNDLEKVKVHGPPKIVEQDKTFPFIVVSPQCPEGYTWTDKMDSLIAILDEVIARYDVDPSRIYLTGLSMGGFGSWELACAYPNRFAAVIPICGGGQSWRVCSLKNVPVWAFHGAKDSVVPIARSEEMVNALKKCGGNVKFTVYPEADHDSWTETYKNPELYKWLLGQKRK